MGQRLKDRASPNPDQNNLAVLVSRWLRQILQIPACVFFWNIRWTLASLFSSLPIEQYLMEIVGLRHNIGNDVRSKQLIEALIEYNIS